MVRCQSTRRPPDAERRVRLRELANERRRFGYRRLFVLLRREGEPSGINRIHRLSGGRARRAQASCPPQGLWCPRADPGGLPPNLAFQL
jgi:hypothetical protein